MNGIIITLACFFFIVKVSSGEEEHVPEDDGLLFERALRNLEQTVLYLYFFLSISMTKEERNVRET